MSKPNWMCRWLGHRVDDESAYMRVWYCERCGMPDPDDGGLLPWLSWMRFRIGHRLWHWYSWVFVPCHWCGRFSWDPRGHKQGDGTNDDDCCIPF